MTGREKISWGIATAAGLLALWQANPWHEFGWTTPHQHAADVSDFRMEWRCDEDSEELADLLGLAIPTPQEAERIRVLREKIDENDCHAYE